MKKVMQHEEICRFLGEIFALIPDPATMATFLDGILTPSELEEVMCRWQLMLKLREGKTQRQIARELGVSLGKISRGSRLLKYGSPEFRRVFEQLTADSSSDPDN